MVREIISKDDLTIVLPILNEKEGVGRVIEELNGYGYKKILVVDGYSSDGSQKIAARNGARVVEQVGKGKTGALLTAVKAVKTPYMLVMDGDFTYEPSCIKRMMAHASSYDEIIGARTDGRAHIPMVNRVGNHLLNWFFRALFAVRLSDPHHNLPIHVPGLDRNPPSRNRYPPFPQKQKRLVRTNLRNSGIRLDTVLLEVRRQSQLNNLIP